ncbi:MAG: hypothetical protein IPP07_17055 [Holophagales bacterium]|nr:hypothetical protein [Holophagales bacterium]
MRSISRLGRAGFEFFSIRVRLAPLLLAGSLLAAAGASAQDPTLVKDIYPGLSSTASPVLYPDSFLGVSGNRAFLRAFSAQGFGLWVADDTAAPPRFLLDFPATSAPGVDLNGSFYFSAASPEGNWLWKTDGTVTGTIPVRRFPANLDHPVQLSKLTKVGGLLYFVTTEAEQAPKLWKSDGTEAGTTLVKALPLSAFGTFSSPRELVDLGGALVFSCHGSPGCGLWKSDGTDAGTVQVSSLDYPSSLLNLNGTLFFRSQRPGPRFRALEERRDDGRNPPREGPRSRRRRLGTGEPRALRRLALFPDRLERLGLEKRRNGGGNGPRQHARERGAPRSFRRADPLRGERDSAHRERRDGSRHGSRPGLRHTGQPLHCRPDSGRPPLLGGPRHRGARALAIRRDAGRVHARDAPGAGQRGPVPAGLSLRRRGGALLPPQQLRQLLQVRRHRGGDGPRSPAPPSSRTTGSPSGLRTRTAHSSFRSSTRITETSSGRATAPPTAPFS